MNEYLGRSATALGCALIFLGGIATSWAQIVQPGTDFFTTDAPFSLDVPGVGPIQFCGDPIGDGAGVGLPGIDLGTTDTIVRRLQPADISGGGPAPIPIEIVSLSLVSCEPITVNFGNGPELWDVRANLSPSGPSLGTKTLQGHQNGGTFDSQFFVKPIFTFTRIGGPPATRFIDGAVYTFMSFQNPWQPTPPPGVLLVPGAQGDGRANYHPGSPQGLLDFFPPGSVPFEGSSRWNMSLTIVPEPATGLALGAGLAWLSRRRKKAQGA